MGTLTKTFIILNLVFSIAFIAVVATVAARRANFKTQLDKSQRDLEVALAAKQKIELESATAIADVKNNLRLAEAERDQKAMIANEQKDAARKASVDLDTLKATHRAVDDQVSSLSKSVQSLEDRNKRLEASASTALEELQAAKKKADDLQDKNVAVATDFSALQVRYDDLKNRNSSTVEELEGYKKSMDKLANLNPQLAAQVRGGMISGPAIPIRGAVKAVDANYGIVILNVGSDQKVEKGYRFLLHRGKQYIGSVRVTEVQKNICATELVAPDPQQKVAIEIGDEAITDY